MDKGDALPKRRGSTRTRKLRSPRMVGLFVSLWGFLWIISVEGSNNGPRPLRVPSCGPSWQSECHPANQLSRVVESRSDIGTTRTFQNVCAMSAIAGGPDIERLTVNGRD